MSPNADDGFGLVDAIGTLARKGARDASNLWGMMLDHLSDNHAKSAAAWKVNPAGGVARTADGVVVTSKELVMEVFLNAAGNYSVEGYRKRMSQSIGPIYLGLDWGPEYEQLSTRANTAIGGVTRKGGLRICAAARPAFCAGRFAGSRKAFDIQEISDIVLAAVCKH